MGVWRTSSSAKARVACIALLSEVVEAAYKLKKINDGGLPDVLRILVPEIRRSIKTVSATGKNQTSLVFITNKTIYEMFLFLCSEIRCLRVLGFGGSESSAHRFERRRFHCQHFRQRTQERGMPFRILV